MYEVKPPADFAPSFKPSDHLLRGRIYGMMGDNTDRNTWYNVDLMGI
jgi:hypothetical protein